MLLRLFLQSLLHMDKFPKAILQRFILQSLPQLEELPKAVLLHLLLQSMSNLDELPRPRCSASSSATCPMDEMPRAVLLGFLLRSLPQLPEAVLLSPKLLMPESHRAEVDLPEATLHSTAMRDGLSDQAATLLAGKFLQEDPKCPWCSASSSYSFLSCTSAPRP